MNFDEFIQYAVEDTVNNGSGEPHDLQGSGSLRKCFTCHRWFHNEADADEMYELCDGNLRLTAQPLLTDEPRKGNGGNLG